MLAGRAERGPLPGRRRLTRLAAALDPHVRILVAETAILVGIVRQSDQPRFVALRDDDDAGSWLAVIAGRLAADGDAKQEMANAIAATLGAIGLIRRDPTCVGRLRDHASGRSAVRIARLAEPALVTEKN